MVSRRRQIFAGIFVAASLYLFVAWFGTGPPPVIPSRNKRILLVSALYPLEKSKHSLEDYRWWLWNYVGHVKTDIYFFAPPALRDYVLETRPGTSDSANSAAGLNFFIKLNTTYPTVFDVPPLKGFKQAYEEMHGRDRERSYHSPELYAVWNAKPFFLKEGLRQMKETWNKDYDYAFWVDAGSFRESPHKYEDWPNPARVEEVFSHAITANSIFIPLHAPPDFKWGNWREEMGPVDQDISEGSFFGGSPKAIEWYASTYYAYHDYWLSMGHFVGKDQTLINAIFLLFRDRFITVLWRHVSQRGYLRTHVSEACGGEWWYYQFFLSDSETRTEMERIWLEKASDRDKKLQKWLVGKPQCPLVRTWTMRDVLARSLGPYWKPPHATVLV